MKRVFSLILALFLLGAALAEPVSEAVDAPVGAAQIALNGLEADDGTADAPAYTGSGWQRIGGSWYYYEGGSAVTGWRKIDAAWYLFSATGAMQTGWQKSGSAWYYLAASGAMATGWQKVGNTWYYFKPSGAMATDWQKIDNRWYYFNTTGAMVTGWQKIDNRWYYFDANGAMAIGRRTIDGKQYTFYANGIMQENVAGDLTVYLGRTALEVAQDLNVKPDVDYLGAMLLGDGMNFYLDDRENTPTPKRTVEGIILDGKNGYNLLGNTLDMKAADIGARLEASGWKKRSVEEDFWYYDILDATYVNDIGVKVKFVVAYEEDGTVAWLEYSLDTSE